MDWQNSFTPLAVNANDALPPLMLAYLPSWGAITLQGDDKKSYLQGQVTCDVVSLPLDQTTLGAHCDAKGKVWSVFRVFHHNGGFAMVQPRSAIDVELREIRKYAVFSKVEINASQEIILGVLGQQAEHFIDSLSEQRGDVRAINGGSAVRIDAERWMLLLDEHAAETLAAQWTANKVDESLWTRFDIEHALPVLGASEQNEHIPQALNLQALGGISFTKGCYTGQETVARAKYRGMNKRAMYIVKGSVSTAIEGTALERAVGDNWRGAGQLLAHYVFADNSAIGLVVLPNNLDADTPLRLQDQPEHTWTIQPLPYTLEENE